MKCPECGHDVSTSATACPNCGAPVKGASPPPLPPPIPVAPAPVRRKSKVLLGILITGACLLVVFVLLAIVLSHVETRQESKLQAAITASLQDELSQNRQKLYEKIHLAGEFGTAKSDVIENVAMQWKGGRATDDAADLSGFSVDHTLYWTTPLTSDGHTKFHDVYECSGGTTQLTDSRIVETNGITIDQAKSALLDFATKEATKAIHDAINGTPAPNP